MTPNVRMQRRGVIEAKIGLTSLAYITGRKTLEKFLLVGLQKKKKKKKKAYQHIFKFLFKSLILKLLTQVGRV